MWLFTNIGFFSVVEKPYDIDQGLITIRSRVRLDLEVLKFLYLPSMTEVIQSNDADYKYRCRVKKRELAEAMPDLIMNINYENFKDEVLEVQGHERASLYGDIWRDAYEMQLQKLDELNADKASVINKISCPFVSNHCIVVIDAKGRVLMNTDPEQPVETAFIHLNARTLRHPQRDVLAHVYQLTGIEGKVAIPCSISRYEPVKGWNFYIVPVEPFTCNSPSDLLPFKWVSIKVAQDMVGPHDLALNIKNDHRLIKKIRSSFLPDERIFV